MKKVLSVLLSVCLLTTTLCVFTLPAIADTSGNYEYFVENGEAIITGYNGIGGNVVIPNTLGSYSVTSIGKSAFYDCTSLTSVTIPSGVTNIGSFAFDGCERLKNVTIPSSVTSIGDYAFAYCEGLTSVTIPDGVTSIGEKSFAWCESLASITISDSVTNIGSFAFAWCAKLICVYYSGTEERWNKIIVGVNKDSFADVIIHFNSTGPTEPITTTPSGIEKNIVYTFIDQKGDTVIVYSDNTVEIVPKSTEPTTQLTTQSQNDVLLGDVNADGTVNMKDVLMLRKYLAGLVDKLGA